MPRAHQFLAVPEFLDERPHDLDLVMHVGFAPANSVHKNKRFCPIGQTGRRALLR